MIGRFIVNVTTVLLALNNCYGYFKDKKSKHYRYYFIILCLFLSFDSLFSYITGLIPFYQVLKFVGIIWLSLPMFNGPVFIYNFYMKKIFTRFESDIDLHLETAREKFVETVIQRLNQAYGKCAKYNERLLSYNGKSAGDDAIVNEKQHKREELFDDLDNAITNRSSFVIKEDLDEFNKDVDTQDEKVKLDKLEDIIKKEIGKKGVLGSEDE